MLIPNMLLKIELGQQIKLQLDQVEADLEYEQMAGSQKLELIRRDGAGVRV